MIVLLRLVGLFNVAVWFGAAIFFTVGVYPAFFSQQMRVILGDANFPFFSGRLAMVLVSRYFLVHYWCGSIALLHQLTERFYLGKPLQRFNFSILIAIYTLALLGGIWLQPTIKRLHSIKYGRADLYSTVQKTQAAKAFAAWSGLAQALNFLITVGVGTYLWRVANPVDTPRFVPSGKFRS